MIFREVTITNVDKINGVGRVQTNEWNGKYFTSLSAWNVYNEFKDAPSEAEKENKNLLEQNVAKSPVHEQDATYSSDNDLPF